MANLTEPQITKTNLGWRVDLPSGDYCFQPSQDFAKRYVAKWLVANREAMDQMAQPWPNWRNV